MPTITYLNPTDVRNIIIKELRKRDKILSKMQLDGMIKQGVIQHTKPLFQQLDKLRRRLNELEEALKR